MDNKGSYSKQFEKKMDRQVGRNVSVTDYFTRKANMHSEMMLGVDSYETRTPGSYFKTFYVHTMIFCNLCFA